MPLPLSHAPPPVLPFSAGLTFVSVHDCFWTHAVTVDTMNKVTTCPTALLPFYPQPVVTLPPLPYQQLSPSNVLINGEWTARMKRFQWLQKRFIPAVHSPFINTFEGESC
jgi:hypothetical protein